MSAPIRWSAHADGACYYFVDGPAGLSAACFDSPAFRRLKALPELEVRWANLSAGPKALTNREAHELALAERDPWLDQITPVSRPAGTSGSATSSSAPRPTGGRSRPRPIPRGF